MQLSQLKTTKGSSLFVYNGKNYRVQKRIGLVTYFECYNCKKGRVNENEHGHVVETKPCVEGCEVNALEQQAKLALQETKLLVKTHPERSLKRCFEDTRTKLTENSLDSLAYLPSFESTSSALQRVRAANRPKLPVDFATLPAIIPESYQQAFGTRTPCLHDSIIPSFLYLDVEYYGPEDPTTQKRILGFMTYEYALKLCSSTHIFIDGTFKTCPVPFYQVFVFSTMIGTGDECRLIPRLYLLLPGKSEHCYTSALNALLESLQIKQHINRETIAWTQILKTA